MTQSPNLDALRWNNRVLLLFAPKVTRQKQLLESHASALEERNLKVFEITGVSEADEQLRGKFYIEAGAFAVVLIGRDGWKKLKRSEPINPNDIFRLIDSMPMRKEEMRRN